MPKLKLKPLDERIDDLLRLLATDSDELDELDALFELGEAFMEEDEYRFAARCFTNFIKRNPEDVATFQNLAECYLKLGELAPALKAARSALAIEQKLKQESTETHILLGYCYERIGIREHAEAHYVAATKIDPTNPHAFFSLAEAYATAAANRSSWDEPGAVTYKTAKYTEAVRAFQNAISLDPDDAYVWYQMACSCFELEHYRQALVYFEKVKWLDSKEDSSNSQLSAGEIEFQIGRTLVFLGRYEDAILVLKESIAYDDQNDEAYNALGDAYYNMDEHAYAAQCYENAIRIDRKEGLYRSNLAYAYMAAADDIYDDDRDSAKQLRTKAIMELNAAIKTNPEDARYYVDMFHVLHSLRLNPNALYYAEETVKLEPDCPHNHVLLVQAYQALELYEQALEEIKIAHAKALKKDKKGALDDPDLLKNIDKMEHHLNIQRGAQGFDKSHGTGWRDSYGGDDESTGGPAHAPF